MKRGSTGGTLMRANRDCLGRCGSRTRTARGSENLFLEAGYPDLEEVVEVLAEDGEEPDALEQGKTRVFRHRQDAFVEVQPRQLAVDVAGRDGAEDARDLRLGVGSGGHEGNSNGAPAGQGQEAVKKPNRPAVVAWLRSIARRRTTVSRLHAPSAATTLENTFRIWLPMVRRMTMTTIETRTRISAYSTIPWPLCWRRDGIPMSFCSPPFM